MKKKIEAVPDLNLKCLICANYIYLILKFFKSTLKHIERIHKTCCYILIHPKRISKKKFSINIFRKKKKKNLSLFNLNKR